ncbi:MAG: hypothetical protein ABJB74_12535 [Gemmatimonas sp.]
MHIFHLSRTAVLRGVGFLAVGAAAVLLPCQLANAQVGGGGGGGQQQGGGSSQPPAASVSVKRIADRDDPILFLLDKKKLLLLDRPLEDSLKNFRKEMQHYQDVAYKDLDKAATKKEQGQLPGTVILMALTKDCESRIKDVQSAYRDRARALLSERQRMQVDSLENIWKRDIPKADSAGKRPPRQ